MRSKRTNRFVQVDSHEERLAGGPESFLNG
jgi:hypothetical protein